jgi:peroxiredoxin Q/BCP
MVSLDTPEKNKEFADSVGAKFVLLSDPDKSSAKKFGVLGLGGMWTKRWTYYIDGKGNVVKIDKQVNTDTHGEDIVTTLGELGFPKR